MSFPIGVSNSLVAVCGGNNPNLSGLGLAYIPAASVNGPFVTSSTNRYIVSISNQSMNGAVLKSADGGSTWAEMDAANAPGFNGFNAYSSVLDHDGIRIWVVFQDFSAELSIAIFNTSTDTWGTVLASVAIPAPFGNVILSAAQDADGNIIAVGIFDAISSTTASKFIVFNGSTWGAFQSFTAPSTADGGLASLDLAFVLTAGNFVHCFFSQMNTSAASVPCFHQSIARGTFTLGALEQIGASGANVGTANQGEVPVPFWACYNSTTGIVSVAASGIGAPTQDFTRLFVANVANAANLGITLTPFSLGLASGRFISAFSLAQIGSHVNAFWCDSDNTLLNANYKYVQDFGKPITLGTGDVGALLQASSVPLTRGFALTFNHPDSTHAFAEQSYWELSGPGATLLAKLRTAAAAADPTLQGFLGTSPFRWYDQQLAQGSAFPAVAAFVVSDSDVYSNTQILSTSSARVQINIFDLDPEKTRQIAAYLRTFFTTFNAYSPPGQTTLQPNRIVNARDGGISQTAPFTALQMLDVMIFNTNN